ncbi:MAG: signal peptidase II [Candidatus Moraniibacteriota bacterium]
MRNSQFNPRKRVPDVILLGALFVSDRLVKAIFIASDRYVCNAFGPWGAPLPSVSVGIVSAIVLFFVAFFWVREERFVSRTALIMIFGGGFGNLYDRVLYGCVSDYGFVSWFPAFNLSDVMLTLGVIILGIYILVDERKTSISRERDF